MTAGSSNETRTVRRMTWIAILAAFVALAPSAGAAKGRCVDAVQGKIAWDHAGSKSWSPTNVRRLCQGAERSMEPARCFERVMHGGVSRGTSTRWEWSNALDLCQGTLDAEATVSCFEKRIAAQMPWKKAITSCRWHRLSPGIEIGPSLVQRQPALDPSTRLRFEEAGKALREAIRSAPDCDSAPDADGDGHADTACGGDDCDDSDASRYPGNAEICDEDGHDEDCDPVTFGRRDADGDGFVSQVCCNRRSDGGSNCGIDCDDSRRAIVPGAQSCADETTVHICGGGLESCSRDGSFVCAPQPNGTGVCVPR